MCSTVPYNIAADGREMFMRLGAIIYLRKPRIPVDRHHLNWTGPGVAAALRDRMEMAWKMMGLKKMKKGNVRDFLNFLLEIILKEKAICCSVSYMLYEFSLPSGLSVAGDRRSRHRYLFICNSHIIPLPAAIYLSDSWYYLFLIYQIRHDICLRKISPFKRLPQRILCIC